LSLFLASTFYIYNSFFLEISLSHSFDTHYTHSFHQLSFKMQLPVSTLLALLPFFLQAAADTGKTTRYWDCCKPSCSWASNVQVAPGSNPVTTCDKNDNPLTDFGAKSACESGGTAYMCSDQSPWAVNDQLSYGFAATTLPGCCACYELTFTSGAVNGKKMIVQATNTGGDLTANQFDIAVSPDTQLFSSS
jgi:hypothetical protein